MLTLFSQPGLARQCRTRSVPPAQTSNANESSHASRPLRQSFGPRSSHVHCKVVDARYDQGSRALSKVTATPSPPGQSSAPPDQSKLFCRVGAPRCWATRLSPVSKKHRPTKLVYSLKDKGLIEQTSRFNKVFGIWDPRNKAIQLNLQAIWVSRLRRVRQKPLREVGALRLCVWLAGVMPLGPAQSSRPPGPPGSRRPSGRRGSRTVHPKASVNRSAELLPSGSPAMPCPGFGRFCRSSLTRSRRRVANRGTAHPTARRRHLPRGAGAR